MLQLLQFPHKLLFRRNKHRDGKINSLSRHSSLTVKGKPLPKASYRCFQTTLQVLRKELIKQAAPE